MYKVNKNNNCHAFDVDDTLVFFDRIEGIDPILITYNEFAEYVYPNQEEINSLKRAKVRGHYVTVHSQGGWEWAEAVVKALNLEEFVDAIKTKDRWYHDDLPADAWMHRIYITPKKKGT